MRASRLRTGIAAAAIVGVLAVPLPVLAAGGKPDIPKVTVLSVYQQTVTTAKLDIKPVTAGLGSVADPTPDMAEAAINPALYRGSLMQLQSYVRAIARVGPRPDIVPRVRFKLDDLANAGAPSSDEIFLTTAMYQEIQKNMAKDPEAVQQLVFILCHEYAHVLYDHPRLYGERDKDVGVAKLFTSAIKVASALNGFASRNGGGTVIDSKAMGAMHVALSLSPNIESEIYRRAYAPYHKEQESLADFMAADLMKKLGRGDARDAVGILTLFEQYDNSVVGQLKVGLKRLDASFDDAFSQIKASAPAALQSGNFNQAAQQAKRSLTNAVLGFLGGIVERRKAKTTAHLYFSRERRADGVTAYANKFYERAAVALSAESMAAWQGRNNVPAPQQMVATFTQENGPDRAAQEARLKLLAGDVPGARAILDALKAKLGGGVAAAKPAPKKKGKGKAPPKPAAPPPGSPIKSAFFHTVDAQVYAEAGDLPGAVAAYRRAIALPEAPVATWLALAAMLDNTGDAAGALAVLNQAGNRFGQDKVILAKIQHHIGRGDITAATALLPTCNAYPDLAKPCAAAIARANDGKDDDKDD